jgi:hypothetical protein
MSNNSISSDYTKPIEDWIEYADFMKSQIDENLPEGNIPGILCKSRDFGSEDSEFNIVFTLITKGDRSDLSSYATIFKENNNAYFFDKIIDIDHYTMCLVAVRSEKSASGFKNDPSTSLQLTNKLCNGEYDTAISEFCRIDFKPRYGDEYTQSNLISIIDPLIQQVILHKNKVTYTLLYITSSGIRHSIACIFWYDGDTMHCGIYDPIFFESGKTNYLFGITTAYIAFRAYGILQDIPIIIQNISSLCYTDPKKGIRCSQYIMNASYCKIYSLYFIFCHLRNGSKCDTATLQKTVNDTYVVDPSELTRSQCKENNRFRIVILNFALTALAIMTDKKFALNEIKRLVNNMKHGTFDYLQNNYKIWTKLNQYKKNSKQHFVPYSIVHPDIEALIDKKLAKLEGGRTKHTRKNRRRISRRYHKTRYSRK